MNKKILVIACTAANDGDTIEVRAVSFTGDLVIEKSVNLKGGFNCDFSSVTGKTIVNGDVIINNGTSVIEDFALEC